MRENDQQIDQSREHTAAGGGAGRRQGALHPHSGKLARVSSRAIGLSAAGLMFVAACSSGGSGPATGSRSPTSAPLTPRQALMAAAARSQQLTSATETLTVRENGIQSGITTGTIKLRLKPTLEASAKISINMAGKSIHVKEVITSTAIYIREPSLSTQLGKPWIKLELSSLKGTALAGVAQLFHNLQSNNFANQTQLFAVAKNTRRVGMETVDGVPTTEYAGSFHAAEALKALPASFRKVLGPSMHPLGNGTITFYIWIDGQHHTRKVTELETVNGETINTTVHITGFNQPLQITPPPASQTVTPPGM